MPAESLVDVDVRLEQDPSQLATSPGDVLHALDGVAGLDRAQQPCGPSRVGNQGAGRVDYRVLNLLQARRARRRRKPSAGDVDVLHARAHLR